MHPVRPFRFRPVCVSPFLLYRESTIQLRMDGVEV